MSSDAKSAVFEVTQVQYKNSQNVVNHFPNIQSLLFIYKQVIEKLYLHPYTPTLSLYMASETSSFLIKTNSNRKDGNNH